jgi:hypothetical protein
MNVSLQFGWHSHVPYVLNKNNYYRENRRELCAQWIIDSVNGFTEYFKIFDDVTAFSSFLSISGQAVEQFVALAEMDAGLRGYLQALRFPRHQLDEIKGRAISLLEKTRHYVANGRLELIGTGFNHPIMAHLHEDDFCREIERIKALYREYFGVTHLAGFFPPESSIGQRDIPLYAANGIQYLVLEDPAYMDLAGTGSGPAGSNCHLLTGRAAPATLHCFSRNRALSLLSWLSDDMQGCAAEGAAPRVRPDIRYRKHDDSVDRAKREFDQLFSGAQHGPRNATTPRQFVDLVGTLARQQLEEHGTQQASLLLFTDHEYLGGAADIFPRMHEAITLLANGSTVGTGLNVRFSTLREAYGSGNPVADAQEIQLRQGSWCSGLMLSDAYLETLGDGTHVYAHGTIADPFSNWKSFSFHYQLARHHFNEVAALVGQSHAPDSGCGTQLSRLDDMLCLASTSCFYGWFPPVYRLIPAFELFGSLHAQLSAMRNKLGHAAPCRGPQWDERALAALQGRLTQFKLSAEGDQACIQRIELSMLCARNIFFLQQADHYASGYQMLASAAKELDNIFEEADIAGTLFQEPNDPWDLWNRRLVSEDYV